ncbi:hypothetical protein [Kiloniella antarctica]|uniref:Uncharacterized protein n=1 Tax=Kiloniella antarctica TaxID=1550907 RepID=A0ABW5BN45_9PROT
MGNGLVRCGILLTTIVWSLSNFASVYANGATVPTPDISVSSFKGEPPKKEGNLFEQYGDWQVTAETFITEDGELRTACSIYTGSEGDSTIRVELSNGDALPPDVMPSIEYDEATVRGYATQIQKNQEITWVIKADKAVFRYTGETYTGYQSGIPYARNIIHSSTKNSDARDVLRAFGKGHQVILFDEYSGGDLYVGSLNGFSAAYRKMSAWCGFSPDNVLN